MGWNDTAAVHYQWVDRMKWHNKTVLESLALIASEIGEVAGESMLGKPSNKFGEELADVVLRTLDLGHELGIDIDSAIKKASINAVAVGLLPELGELYVEFARWVNSARKMPLDAEFENCLGCMLARVNGLAANYGVNLESEVAAKMARNQINGTRGRVI